MLEEEAVRREKLQRLRDAGIDPYPASTHRDADCGAAVSHFEEWSAAGKTVAVAGRLHSIRAHGGAAFADLVDQTGKLQLHLKEDVLGKASFDLFFQNVDHGDFLEASGTLFATKRGEKTLEVKTWKLLTKALLPMPEKWHGLSDVEIRYRKRYLDLLSNESVKDTFRKRSMIVSAIRRVLEGEGFMEVETPILQTIAGGASAKPFKTHHNALDIDLFLRVAPELYLKRLLVGGFEKVFEVARCFRNEGISFQHNPEFTQVEFYWAYSTYEDLMALTERMLTEIVGVVTGGDNVVERDGVQLSFATPFPRVKFYDIVKEKTGIDLELESTEELLRNALQSRNFNLIKDYENAVGYGELVDVLYKTHVRPHIIQPTFLLDYPQAMIPLAKRKPDAPGRIATMQLLVQGMEVCKAYNELNDPLEQEANFIEEEMKKGKGSEEAQATDADFVEALKHGMPPAAGFGMGIDRLSALLTGAHSVKEVILFPTMRPETVAAAPAGTTPAKAGAQKSDLPVFDQIKNKLDDAGVAYDQKHHAADELLTSTLEVVAKGTMAPEHGGAKAIVLKGKKTGAFHLFVLPDDLKIDQKKVKAIVGENVSFASPDEVKEVTGCVVGSVPPFGSVIGLKTHVDEKLAENSVIFFNAGSLTDSIRMSFSDYIKAEGPERVDVSA